MRAHELQREDAHANRDEQQRKEYRKLFSIDPQSAKKVFSRSGATAQRNGFAFRCVVAPLREKYYLVAVTITFHPILFLSFSKTASVISGDRNRSSARINCSTSTLTSLNIPNNSRICFRL